LCHVGITDAADERAASGSIEWKNAEKIFESAG
jgi:hypothetical protein